MSLEAFALSFDFSFQELMLHLCANNMSFLLVACPTRQRGQHLPVLQAQQTGSLGFRRGSADVSHAVLL